MNSWLEKMYEVFDHTPVIDTHSHVMPLNELYDHRQDFLVNFCSSIFRMTSGQRE